MAARALPDAEYLRQCFSYDPDTGTLTWRRRPREHFKTARDYNRWNGRYSGNVAGVITPAGYLYAGLKCISVKKRRCAVHRIVWKMTTDEDPPNEIDHINRNPADNRWVNLRLAVPAQNSKNKRMYKNNKTGFTGVQLKNTVPGRPYQALITVDGNPMLLGMFSTAEEAHEVYTAAAKHYFGEFRNDGK